jgi:inosine/xanthosine triphosphate pyrophosphatase family protein
VNDWLGVQDYLNLMQDKSDRSACFIDVTAIGFPDGSSEAFSVKVPGSIADCITNEDEWPANALFIPEGYEVPLGSISNDEQVQFWGDGNWPAVIEYFEKKS